MSKFLKLAITALVALSIWACVDNATNKPANSNANSNANANATASKAAPALDTLMAQEKAANEAYTKGDGQFFQNLLSDKFMMNMMGKSDNKADTVKMISGVKCDVKSTSVDEGKLAKIDDDTYAVVYKTTGDGTCTFEGKKEALGTIRAATVWTRSGEKWEPVWHGEAPIVEMKKPEGGEANKAPAPPAKSDEKKAPEKPAANSNTSASSNSNSAAPAADPNVAAMAAVEKAGWEAWKARDATKLEELTDKEMSFVDLFGNVTTGQADTIKAWTGGQCDIKSVSVTDTSGESLSPTVGMLMFKGSADGTCDGMKIKPLWGTSFYKKEGDTWKLVFGLETPA
jgi:hypothetical protein